MMLLYAHEHSHLTFDGRGFVRLRLQLEINFDAIILVQLCWFEFAQYTADRQFAYGNYVFARVPSRM